MSDLLSICRRLYDRQATEERLLCLQNGQNKSLSDEALRAVEQQCLSLAPGEGARACARSVGMELKEPGQRKELVQPPVTLVEGTTPREECAQKCNADYLNNQISEKEWDKCIDRCWLGADLQEAIERSERIEARDEARRERASLAPWGKFALKLGIDATRRYTLFKDVFREWNTAQHSEPFTPAASNDGTIDRGWRTGMRLALTTDPGLTRIPDSNVLFRVTLLDVTIYDNSSHSLGINEETDVIANNEAVGPADNSHVTVLAAEWQIPFFERNFFEIGATYLDDDLLWWKSRALFIILPTNVHTGFNWQFQGTPITVSDRVLDVTGMSHILSSYTMLGVRADFSAVHTFSDAKGAEFCNRVSENCENHKIGPEGDRSLQIGDNRFFPNSSGLSQIDPVGHRPYKFQLALQAHLFGEQRWHWGAVVYRGYADYYPTWKKTETAGEASIHVNLGQAMEFYVEGKGRWLHSLREDQDILLPDSGFEYGFNTGLALRPSRFF